MMTEVARLNLAPGTLWDFAPHGKRKVDDEWEYGRFALGRYRVLHVGHHWPDGQEQVAYVGEGGTDDGQWHWCSLADFATKFIAVGEEPGLVRAVPPKHGPIVLPPPCPLDRLRVIAQTAANEWHEPVLLIAKPAPTSITESARYLPYVVLLSQSEAHEQAAPQERIEPQPRSTP